MKKNTQKNSPLSYKNRAVIAALILTLGAVTTSYYYWFREAIPVIEETKEAPPRVVWMNIFMHGSFGTVLGLLSVFNVMKDAVDNTNYKKMTSHMRYDHFFYQLQPLLAPGLFHVDPTFDASQYPGTKYAIFPVTAAYKALDQWDNTPGGHERFYTFGWSGLVSQGRRRKEALRFYNMLEQECRKLRKQNMIPKVRIITHSHGGNVALNMAGVYELLKNPGLAINEHTFPEEEHRKSLLEMRTTLQSLKRKEDVINNLHQKKWDYIPRRSNLTVDELILLGTPIQPETQHFFFSPFFKKIYNFYSDDDKVQRMDWVSTKRYYSEQRLNCTPVNTKNKVIQARITLNKVTAPNKDENKKKDEHPGILSLLFSMGKSKQEIKDPSHKELWFMGWKANIKKGNAQEHIQPYPFAILVPLLKRLIDKHDLSDVDVKLDFTDDKLSLNLYEHNIPENKACLNVPRSVLKDLQDKAASWQPEDVTRSNEMNILHRYSQMLF